MLNQLRLILKTMRPRQWPKNLFVLAGLIFDGQLSNLTSLSVTLLAFALFCLVSSLVYIINDLTDIKSDQLHPQKRKRPLASGQLSQKSAIIAALLLIIITFPTAFYLNVNFGLIITGYFLLMLAYSLWLKRIPIIDVMIIAAGFVLRVAAGVVVIVTTKFSPWLFVATTFLALFIALGKRRAEIDLLESAADSHRQVLKGYSLELLDQLLTIVMASTLMTYCLYTFSSPITPGNNVMMLTIPFVMYGLFRYLYLIRMEHIGGAPEEIVLTDLPMQITVGLWGLTVVIILYIL
ncbi:MAG: Putative prenyltransferase [Anaerolinea thermophila]|uniref:Putative prenyltransferase n=1 Tax=Anaerolinea thermophila TaxID=167964 RepID=A0A117LGP0_9CHLR|nr:MAG: Putative prenyltransferase [Anaerolinea thermophila]